MNKYHFKLRLLPTILFSAYVILIVRAHSYSMDFEDMPNIPMDSETLLWDVFSYAKSVAILVITVYAFVSMLYLLLIGQMKIKKTIIYIPMLVYTIGVVVSYVFSDYKWLALNGGAERFEGTKTIICYMFMLFYTINAVDEIRDVLVVVISTMTGAFLACLVGLTQFISHDILLSDLFVKIITGSGNLSLSAKFKPGQVYQTVANMNYVGMYLSLIFPILLYFIYYLCRKRNSLRLYENGINKEKRLMLLSALVLLFVLIIINVIGSFSIGGVFGMTAAVFLLIINMVTEKRVRYALIFMAVISFAGMLVFSYVTGNDDYDKLGHSEKIGHRQVDSFETGPDVVKMSVDGIVFSIIYHRENDDYELQDDAGNPLKVFWFAGQDGIYQIEDTRYSGKVRVTPYENNYGDQCVAIDVMGKNVETFLFAFYEDGAKFLNPFGHEVSLHPVDSMLFKEHLSAGSGRLYVWSRALPLLKGRFFKGYGADTFIAVFPHDDYAGKYSAGMPETTVVDKPHSVYLNMALGTGILSMIAFGVMAGMALFKIFSAGQDKMLIKAMAAGVFGFLVAGLFNDSTVCIMPMFYGLLGTAIAGSIIGE